MDKGHNNPPEMIDLAKEVTRQISHWFSENPVVSTEKEAKEIKLQIDRAKLCLKDLEDERDGKVRPLNDKVNAINAVHKTVRRPLGAVQSEMLGALDVYIKAVEDKRLGEAVEARQRAREAEQKAREAEKLERDQQDSVLHGEVGIDIAAAAEHADAAFAEYEKATRAAIRAETETHVKIAGGIGRAISIREKEILQVDDPIEAMKDMGFPPTVLDALMRAARAFRKITDRLPKGVSITIERHI